MSHWCGRETRWLLDSAPTPHRLHGNVTFQHLKPQGFSHDLCTDGAEGACCGPSSLQLLSICQTQICLTFLHLKLAPQRKTALPLSKPRQASLPWMDNQRQQEQPGGKLGSHEETPKGRHVSHSLWWEPPLTPSTCRKKRHSFSGIFLMKDATPPKDKLSLCKVGTLLPIETLQDHFSKEKRQCRPTSHPPPEPDITTQCLHSDGATP